MSGLPAPQQRSFIVELLEPRLLLSADLLPGITWQAPMLAAWAAAEQTTAEPASTARVNLAADALRAAASNDYSNAVFGAYSGAQAALRDGLAQLQTFANSVDEFGVLATPLPLADRSLGSLIDLGGIVQTKIVDPITTYLNDPSLFPTSGDKAGVPNTMGVVAALQAKLSAIDPDAVVAGGLTTDGNQMLFAITFTAHQTEALAADLNSAFSVPGVHFDAAANLDLKAGLTLNLTLGIQLTPATITRDAFFVRINQLSANAQVDAHGLALNATIGPIDAMVSNGSVKMAAQADVSFGAATLSFAQLQTAPLGTLASLSASGTLAASLPIVASVGGYVAASPQVDVHYADVFKVDSRTVTKANFADLNRIVAMLDSFASTDGLSKLLTSLQQSLDGGVFAKNLPLVGDKLQSLVKVLAQARGEDLDGNGTLDSGEDLNGNGTLDPGIIGRIKAGAGRQAGALQQAIFEALGPAGLNLLDKDLDDAGDDGVADVAPDIHDVLLAVSGQQVQFDVRLIGGLDRLLPFDIGLPGLGLAVDGNVRAQIGYTLALGFGAQMSGETPEFYIDTGQMPELTVDAKVSAPGLSATGSLGFLHLSVADSMLSPSAFDAAFTVDLKDPGNTGRLLVSQLAAGLDLTSLVEPTLTANALVDLLLKVDVGDANFPSFSTDFRLDWHFDAASGLRGNRPDIGFNHTTLDLGNFFERFAGPIVKQLNTVLAPLTPIRDFLNQRIPVLSDLSPLIDLLDQNADGEVSLKDLAIKANKDLHLGLNTELFEDIDRLVSLAERVTAFVDAKGQIPIDFGSRSLTEDIRDLAPGDLASKATLAGADPAPKEDQIPAGNKALGLFSDLAGLGIAIAPFNGNGGALNAGAIFDLLLGKPGVDLLTWNPPQVVLGSATEDIFKLTVPILPPFLNATIGGKLYLTANLGFGYDTTGLQAYQHSGFSDLSMLGQGFYVSDWDPITGFDRPELALTGIISAGAELNAAGLIRAGVAGDVTATIGFNLHDSSGDGKLRPGEIKTRLAVGDAYGVGPLALFDLQGAVTAGLSAYIWTGIKIPFDGKLTLYEARKELFRGTLLNYNLSFPDEVPPTAVPALGAMSGNSLVLAMDLEKDDDFGITHLSGGPNDPAGESVVVSARGRHERFDGVSRIVAHAGAGNDLVTIDAGVLAMAEIYGEDGNDTLMAGSGATLIDGGQGNDVLVGGAGDDILRDSGTVTVTAIDPNSGQYSTDADDVIFGRGGNDSLDGGEGRDWLEGGAGDDHLADSGVVRHVASTEDPSTGQAATDADDRLFGDTSDAAAVDGGSGNDVLDGGAGNDALNGGAGNDLLRGGSGGDRHVFVGVWGNDVVEEAAGDPGQEDTADFSRVDNALQVVLAANGFTVTDAVSGSVLHAANLESLNTGNGQDSFDITNSNASALDIHGGDGSDVVLGADANSLWSVSGQDMFTVAALTFRAVENIAAGSGADHFVFADGTGLTGIVDGGPGHDALDYSAYLSAVQVDLLQGKATNLAGLSSIENVAGGTGSDTLVGDAGANSLTGGDGNDRLDAGAGNDALDGGSGNNVLLGGAGNDLYHFAGDWGSNTLEDASGDDTVDFSAVSHDLIATLTSTALTVTESGSPYSLSAAHIEHLLTGPGNDRILAAVSAGPVVDVMAGAGNDTVVGPDKSNRWSINENDLVMLDDVLFVSTENIEGGQADDLFELRAGKGLTGRIAGGGGTDILSYEAYATSVAVDLASGKATRIGGGVSAIENVVGGTAADVLAGDSADNLLAGLGGDDRLEGRGGNDSLFGGSGDDRYVFAGLLLGSDTLIESDLHNDAHDLLDFSAFSEGIQVDLSTATTQTVMPTHLSLTLADPEGFEDVLGSASRGNGLSGNARDNRLQGGSASDYLAGGAGDDRYIFLNGWGTDTIVEQSGAGMDTYDLSQVTADVVAHIDAADISVSSGSNLIISRYEPMDHLITGSGNDRFLFSGIRAIRGFLAAGAGIDTLDYSARDQAVSVDLGSRLADGVGGEVTGIESVVGGRGSDWLIGDGQANTLTGNAGDDQLEGRGGDDLLDGGSGNDQLVGGTGNDRYVFAGKGLGADMLRESAGGAGEAANDLLDVLDFSKFDHSVKLDLGVTTAQTVGVDPSDLTLSLSGTDVVELVVGSAHDDKLFGNARDNQLEGGRGNDQLTGRAGHDRYVFAGTQLGVDAVFEQGGLLDPANDQHDLLDFSTFAGPVAVDLGRSSQQVVNAGNLSLYLSDALSVEDVVGSAFADTIRGNLRFNTYGFRDGWGRDTITELAGGGADSFDFSAVTKPLVVRVTDMLVSSGNNLVTSLGEKVENVVGGQAADRFDFGISGSTTGYLDGGEGVDTLNYASYGSAVSVNLSKSAATGAGDGHPGLVRNIEDVVGSKAADSLTGDKFANRLDGNGGNDSIAGLDGDDVMVLRPTGGVMSMGMLIDGGSGNDTLRFIGKTLDLRAFGGLVNAQTGLLGIDRIDIRDSQITQLVVDEAAVENSVGQPRAPNMNAPTLTVIADQADTVGDGQISVKDDHKVWIPGGLDSEGFSVYRNIAPGQATLRLTECRLGDFNCDGHVDMADFNLLMVVVKAGGSSDPLYDLNRNGVVNVADSRFLVTLFDPATSLQANATPVSNPAPGGPMTPLASPLVGALVSLSESVASIGIQAAVPKPAGLAAPSALLAAPAITPVRAATAPTPSGGSPRVVPPLLMATAPALLPSVISATAGGRQAG